MKGALEAFRKEELDEVFPHPPIREVAFEIRFSPRLRVNAELWKLQDQLVGEYPTVTTESLVLQAGGGMLTVNVFQNLPAGRVIKVSQENFVIAFTRYTRFEDFKEEVTGKTNQFCEVFGVKEVTRIGLRYVNNIFIPPSEDNAALLKYVRPLTDFDRVDINAVEQFLTEVRLRYRDHLVTIRGVLLPPLDDRRRSYVLDIDCHSQGSEPSSRVTELLEAYHDSSQRFFLDHITDDLKNAMRGKR